MIIVLIVVYVYQLVLKMKTLELNSLNECYAVRSKSADDLDCASGGAASVFSRYFLNENGIVCGVAFDKEHIPTIDLFIKMKI